MNTPEAITASTGTRKTGMSDILITVLITVALLYLFLIGVKSLETGVKVMGGGFAKTAYEDYNK